MTKEMKRQELIRALREGTLTPDQIAEMSEDHRLMAELLRDWGLVGSGQLVSAPETIIRKAEAIFEEAQKPSMVKSLLAKLVFDSWTMPLPAGVRGATTADERRLRFEAGPHIFDMRAEKQGGKYHFTAEITGPSTGSEDITLIVDSKSIHAGSHGLFEWSSARPPRKLALDIGKENPVELPAVTWNKPAEK